MASIWPWRKSAEKGAEDGSSHGRSTLYPPSAITGPVSTPLPHLPNDKSLQPSARRPLTDVLPMNSASAKPDPASRGAADYSLHEATAPGSAKSTPTKPLADLGSEGVDMFDAVDALEEFNTPQGSTPQYSTPQFSTPQFSTPQGGTPLGASPGTKYGHFFSAHAASGKDRVGGEPYTDVGAQLDAASKKLAAERPTQKGLAALLHASDTLKHTPSRVSEAGASRDGLDRASLGIKAKSSAAQLEGVAGGLQDLEEKLARISVSAPSAARLRSHGLGRKFWCLSVLLHRCTPKSGGSWSRGRGLPLPSACPAGSVGCQE